ncbi:MAG: hypothetical protein AAF557_15605 [Pseudomonadota bacterium]
MKLRFAVLGLAAILAACDEPTVISHVDRRPNVAITDLWTAQGPDGVRTEIHGLPFKGVAPKRLAEVLRPPASASNVTFNAVPVGSHGTGHAWRLVLHFNPAGAPNSTVDCKRTVIAETAPQPTEGYSVNATFCKGTEWQAHGFMKVLKAEPGDLQSYSQHMQALLNVIFREEPDR